MTSSRPVFRFAPSPNGFLHLGHALSALLNFELARRSGGRFLLRIEDIDKDRSRPRYEAAIYEDLAWLGLTWEQPIRRQSEHFSEYRAALDRLTAAGLTYPSFLSRAEVTRLVAAREVTGAAWPRDPDGAPLYPGSERDLPTDEIERRTAVGKPFVIRLKMDEAVRRTGPLTWRESDGAKLRDQPSDPLAWGDVVLARRDTPTSYHLAVVLDDALQGITDIARGRDLFAATAVHRVLQTLLGLPAPTYRHHRLILDASGQKLAKSAASVGLRSLRESGATPADIRKLVNLDAELAAMGG